MKSVLSITMLKLLAVRTDVLKLNYCMRHLALDYLKSVSICFSYKYLFFYKNHSWKLDTKKTSTAQWVQLQPGLDYLSWEANP